MEGGSKWKMKRYTAECREWAIQQMMPPLNRAVVELAKATGITTVTLRTWQKMARAEGRIVPGDGKQSDRWSSTDKFRIVLETAPLSEAELSAYCRTKGIYPEQVAQWRIACEQANAVVTVKSNAVVTTNTKHAQRIRELERKLKKTDAARAEAEALLVLRKKAEAIWGKDEEE
jgi:transposase-like protein